jgi:hypothetical protein
MNQKRKNDLGLRTLWIQFQRDDTPYGKPTIEFSETLALDGQVGLAITGEYTGVPDLYALEGMPDSGAFFALADGYTPTRFSYEATDPANQANPLHVTMSLRPDPPGANIQIEWNDLVNGTQLSDGDIIRVGDPITSGNALGLHTVAPSGYWKRVDVWSENYGIMGAAETQHGFNDQAYLSSPDINDSGYVPNGMRMTLWKGKLFDIHTPMYWLITPNINPCWLVWEQD